MGDVLLDDYRWLVGGPADALLEELANSREPMVQLASRLRRTLSAARTHLLLEQAELRRRAKQKFAHPQRMFFTPLALEQATDETVAAYKAERFPNGPIADLCCGIGGDFLALAGRAAALGIDRDRVAALFAATNVARSVIHKSSCVVVADALSAQLRSAAAWHIDPDRRPQGRRTTRAALHSPDPETIDRLRGGCPAAAVKLAPAAELPQHWMREAELEWISRGRECRQLVAWFGPLARNVGRRSATVLGADKWRTVAERVDAALPIAERIQRYVFEPDAAVLAADLTAALADEHDLAAFAPGLGYLTGASPAVDLALSTFEVLEVLPLRAELVAGWLRQRGIGRVEIKKRGIDIDPEQFRRKLRPSGSGEAVLLVAPFAGKPVVVVARRFEQPGLTARP